MCTRNKRRRKHCFIISLLAPIVGAYRRGAGPELAGLAATSRQRLDAMREKAEKKNWSFARCLQPAMLSYQSGDHSRQSCTAALSLSRGLSVVLRQAWA